MQSLFSFISQYNGCFDKSRLILNTQNKFHLIKDRSIYYNDNFAIRFSQSQQKKLSNTILSLSTLQKYDNKPVYLCIVTPNKNFLQLINSSFLSKISHSSQQLRINNIKGSFNGSDIIQEVDGKSNEPKNFKFFWDIHKCFSFEDNLERLVANTNNIQSSAQKVNINNNIYSCIERAVQFNNSKYFIDLQSDLYNRVKKVQNEIIIAAFIDNVNIRGRIIEYLITSDSNNLKKALSDSLLNNKSPLPKIKCANDLGDYEKIYTLYNTKTDIKTKIMFLNGNPKGYNIDKILSFLNKDKSIYMIYLVGITANKNIKTRLISCFDSNLIDNTHIMKQWAGRNRRGVTQFRGDGLLKILNPNFYSVIDIEKSKNFLKDLINS